jgi:hypothetical protein
MAVTSYDYYPLTIVENVVCEIDEWPSLCAGACWTRMRCFDFFGVHSANCRHTALFPRQGLVELSQGFLHRLPRLWSAEFQKGASNIIRTWNEAPVIDISLFEGIIQDLKFSLYSTLRSARKERSGGHGAL